MRLVFSLEPGIVVAVAPLEKFVLSKSCLLEKARIPLSMAVVAEASGLISEEAVLLAVS